MAGLGALGGLGGSTFTVMAIVRAVDEITAPFEKMNETVAQFSDTLRKAAGDAGASGAEIDSALLETASGTDALALAEARLTAAENDQAIALERQAAAERELMTAMEEVALAGDTDVAAATRLSEANRALTTTLGETAAANRSLAAAEQLQSDAALAQARSNGEAETSTSTFGAKASAVASAVGKVGLVMDAAGALSAKMAADFQTSTTVLATSGGETAGAIIEVTKAGVDMKGTMDQVRQGILQLAADTGTSTTQLVKGMYLAGSAGYTGAAGINVMRAAAEGAKAENADLGTVTNAVTTVMTDYGITAKSVALDQSKANAVMNELIATTSRGKTTTEQLASAMSTVLPKAANAKIQFSQVAGAMATMTAQGVSAQESSFLLAHAITSLQNPNNVQIQEMQALGINSQQLQHDLGTQGLTGTYQELSNAILKHMGPSGQVVQSAFTNSANAMKDAKAMMATMPSDMQTLAQSFLNGSITVKDWKNDINALPTSQYKVMTQFATLAEKTHSFNSLLAAGNPAAQTYQQAMNKMTGGQMGLQAALLLTGNNMTTFKNNVNAISAAATKGTNTVSGWSEVQGTFNQKVSEAKQTLDVTAIAIGTALLPAITKIMNAIVGVIKPIAEWVQGHQKLSAIILGSVAALFTLVGVINLTVKAFKSVKGAIDSVAGGIKAVTGLFTRNAAAQEENATASEGAAVAAEEETVAFEEQQAAIDELIASAEELSIALEEMMAAEEAASAGAETLTIATEELDVAEAANPIGLIILAVMALVAAFIYCWTHFKGFRDFWKAAWNDIKVAAEAVWHFLDAVWKGISSGAEKLWHDVVGFFNAISTGIGHAVEDILDWVKSHWLLILSIIGGPLGLVVGLVIKYWDDIKNFVVKAVDDIISWVTGHWRLIISIIGGPLGIVVALVTKYWNDIKRWFTDGVNAVKTALAWFDNLNLMFKKWLDGAVSSVMNGINSVVGWFRKLPQEIRDLLNDAGVWLIHVGEEIINGLSKGITNAVGGLLSNVKSLGSTVVGAFKSVFSIFSPSKVMADQVGKYIPDGIALGITSNLSSIQKAVKQAGQVTVTAGQQAISGIKYAPTALPQQTLTSTSTNTGANVYVDMRGCQMMTDRDMQAFVTKMGSALAKYILPQGGLRVGYPR